MHHHGEHLSVSGVTHLQVECKSFACNTIIDVYDRRDPEQFLQQVVIYGQECESATTERAQAQAAYNKLSAVLQMTITPPSRDTTISEFSRLLTERKSQWFARYVRDPKRRGRQSGRRDDDDTDTMPSRGRDKRDKRDKQDRKSGDHKADRKDRKHRKDRSQDPARENDRKKDRSDRRDRRSDRDDRESRRADQANFARQEHYATDDDDSSSSGDYDWDTNCNFEDRLDKFESCST